MNDRQTAEADAARRDGFDPEQFFKLASRVGHGQALGLRYLRHEGPTIELELPWKEELVGVPSTGYLASGAIISLMDTCAGSSVWIALGRFQPLVTIDLRLDYYRPALKGETVIARCQCDKLTRQIAFVSGFAHTGNPDRPVARATGSFMINP